MDYFERLNLFWFVSLKLLQARLLSQDEMSGQEILEGEGFDGGHLWLFIGYTGDEILGPTQLCGDYSKLGEGSLWNNHSNQYFMESTFVFVRDFNWKLFEKESTWIDI